MRSTPLYVRVALILLSAVVITACGGGHGDSSPSRALDLPSVAPVANGLPAVDRKLLEVLETAQPEEDIEVIVSFPGKTEPTQEQKELLYKHGVRRGIHFKHLPIAGVLAKPAQVRALMEQRGLLSLWFNAELQYEDDVARALTGVDDTFSSPVLKGADGQPIDGRGITILVNDSGIDATHPDLQFGSKVVENVAAQTNLRLLVTSDLVPATPTEGVPNSDLLGSHGTHVAGIAAGDGSASNGRFAGVARGAQLIGYGSGATLLVLDSIGGFDYAAEIAKNRPELNLRIVTNSFGSTGDQGTDFDPLNPTNIATKILSDMGLIVVFSAGNSGPGPSSITGNFKKAPWVLVAANGTKEGFLARSSSRGKVTDATYQVQMDGETFTITDQPLVITPGTDYIAARAVAADPFLPLDVPADATSGDIPPDQVPFYTMKSGTSMAAPHLAGLVAMLLQVNPDLDYTQLKTIFQATATNIPGYAPWQAGAGLANIEAAVAMAQGRNDYGALNNAVRDFNGGVILDSARVEEIDGLSFVPAGVVDERSFEVADDVALVVAFYTFDETNPCTCGVRLTAPDGKTYDSGPTLPVLGPRRAAAAPGMPGTWTVQIRGLTGLVGTDFDPLDLTNGYSAPAVNQAVRLEQYPVLDIQGLDDVLGVHPRELDIMVAVNNRLMDSRDSGLFEPNSLLTQAELAEYIATWGIRQTRSHDGSRGNAVSVRQRRTAAAAEITAKSGHLVLDLNPEARAVIEHQAAPQASVSVQEAAFALVQAKGDESAANSHSADAGMVFIDEDGRSFMVADALEVEESRRGHLQQALLLGIVEVEIVDGVAFMRPNKAMTRAEYASMAARASLTLPLPR